MVWYSIECVLFCLLVRVQTSQLPTLLCTQTYQPKSLLDLKKLFCSKTKVNLISFLFQIDIRHSSTYTFPTRQFLHICKKHIFTNEITVTKNTLVTNLGVLFQFHSRAHVFCNKKKKDLIYFACKNIHCGSWFETLCLQL